MTSTGFGGLRGRVVVEGERGGRMRILKRLLALILLLLLLAVAVLTLSLVTGALAADGPSSRRVPLSPSSRYSRKPQR